jgi:hypothetical protein
VPKIGPSFDNFLRKQRLDAESEAKFVDSTLKVLNRTGLNGMVNEVLAPICQLVVGQVQSGKTMSFTGLIAASRDVSIPLVIVIAGTKKNLVEQSVKRLEKDLQLNGDGGANPWSLKLKPSKSESSDIIQNLQSWSDPSLPNEFKKTSLLVALKSKAGITKLAELMVQIGKSIDMQKIKVLIIDDEADQASLNTKVNSKKSKNDDDKSSAIYSAITQLRNGLPAHSFVMYTATPQAPLLLKLADHLSPEFVTLLSPGDDYLGGRELFSSDSSFAIEIPSEEVDYALDPQFGEGAPMSLRASIAYYLLALTVAQERQNPKPLTMMIHPDSSIALHGTYDRWVKAILNEWQITLSDDLETGFSELMFGEFSDALKLLMTNVTLPEKWKSAQDSFEIFKDMISYTRAWIGHVEIRIINGENKDIDPAQWTANAGWIVIGGNKLERGFTIENLAVTYMPRGSGVGNADVIQQRARFFGYKKKYRDLLKAWLSSESIQNYKDYVEHEIEMHRQLRELDISNETLKNWRRKFLLDKSLNVCRKQVQSLPVAHEQLNSGFVFRQSQLYVENLEKNHHLVDKINEVKHSTSKAKSDARPDKFTEFSIVDTDVALEILADWNASPEEREQLDRLIFALQIHLEKNPELKFSICFIDKVIGGIQYPRRRNVAKQFESENFANRQTWRIKNLFQGKNPKEGDLVYPGDDKLRFPETVTIQIHKVTPHHLDTDYKTIYATAVSMPDAMSTGVVWELDH